MDKNDLFSVLKQLISDPSVLNRLKDTFSTAKSFAQNPLATSMFLWQNTTQQKEIIARQQQQHAARAWGGGLSTMMGAGSPGQGGLNYYRLLAGYMGSDYAIQSPYSTSAFSREFANAEFGRRSEELLGQTSYSALNYMTTGISGVVGRRLGVEAYLYNRNNIERNFERMSRGLTTTATGGNTSAYGVGFRAGTMGSMSDMVAVQDSNMQRQFGYSARQLDQMRSAAMRGMDTGTVNAIYREGGQRGLAEGTMSLTGSVSNAMRTLQMSDREVGEFFNQLASFGERVDKSAQGIIGSLQRAKRILGEVSGRELAAFRAESRGVAAQRYLGDRTYAQEMMTQMTQIGSAAKAGPMMSGVARQVLSRYGGVNAAGYANFARSVAEGGYNYMESGMGLMTRTAMLGGGVNTGTSLGNLIGGAAGALGRNPFAALEAQVDENVRGEVAGRGMEYALGVVNQMPILQLTRTGKQRAALKAKLLSQLTGKNINEAHDYIQLDNAQNDTITAYGHRMGIGSYADSGEFKSRIKAYARKNGISVEEATRYLRKKMETVPVTGSKEDRERMRKESLDGMLVQDKIATEAWEQGVHGANEAYKEVGSSGFFKPITTAINFSAFVAGQAGVVAGWINRRFGGSTNSLTGLEEDLNTYQGMRQKRWQDTNYHNKALRGMLGDVRMNEIIRKTRGQALTGFSDEDDEDVKAQELLNLNQGAFLTTNLGLTQESKQALEALNSLYDYEQKQYFISGEGKVRLSQKENRKKLEVLATKAGVTFKKDTKSEQIINDITNKLQGQDIARLLGSFLMAKEPSKDPLGSDKNPIYVYSAEWKKSGKPS